MIAGALLHSTTKAAMCGLRLVQPSMQGFEAGVTSQGSSGGLGSLVVKAPFMKWGNSGFESWSGHVMHLTDLLHSTG